MSDELTLIIQKWGQGDSSATERLYQFAYLQLREIAQQERKKLSIKHGDDNLLLNEEVFNTTSLIHAAYVKLESSDVSYILNRREFYLMASKVMRQIMYETARKSSALKRQALFEHQAVINNDDLLEKISLIDSLEHFSEKYSRQSEVLQLRYFMGMTNTEISHILHCSESLIDKDIKFGKSWIKNNLIRA